MPLHLLHSLIKLFLVPLSLTLGTALAYANVDFGVGMTSAMGGRQVPSLSAAYRGAQWEFTGFATGVQNEFYFHSAYGLNGYRVWKSGLLLNGQVLSGFGLGAIYSTRGFMDTGATTEDTKADVALGPALEMLWFFAGPVYLRLEALYGLRDLGAHLTLNAQDFVHLSLGLSL